MHIVLTDVLTCPRCGPQFGLIVLADRQEDRRVVAGELGCANCREHYPIREGVADLRGPGSAETFDIRPASVPEEAALRLAALLGVQDRPGPVLLCGVEGDVADEVARLLPNSLVARAVAQPEAARPSRKVSPLLHGARLPFRSGTLRGVALSGTNPDALVEEAVRVLGAGGRIVVEGASPEMVGRLEELGLQVLLQQEGVVVALLSPDR